MRVLMTSDTVGGVWTYAVQLIAALRPHGVDVMLATMGGPLSPAQRAQADALANLTLAESDSALEWMTDPWADVDRAGDWLLKLEQAHALDVVHLNGYAYGQKPFAAPVVTVAHSCCLTWWQAVKGEPPPAEWGRYRSEVAAGVAGADLLVAPTRAMLDAFEQTYRPRTPGRVIHNGRAQGVFVPARKRNVILSAGRLWDEAKNLGVLQRAAAGVPWPVCVAGSTAHPDGRAVTADGLERLGVLDEPSLAARMSEAAIYALPALYEPFGLSVLEAASCGCALVLGDIPSLREVWGDAAVYVNPREPDALAEALRALIADPDARRTLSAKAMRRAARYTAASMADGYVDAYVGLIHSRGRSHAAERTPEAVA